MAGSLLKVASETTPVQNTVVKGIVGTFQLCQANPLRYSLIICVNDTDKYFISMDANTDGTVGIPCDSARELVMDLPKWGSLAQQAWFTHTGVGAAKITVFELLFNKDE